MDFVSFPSFDLLALCVIALAIVQELWVRLFFSVPKQRLTRAQAKAMAAAGEAEAQLTATQSDLLAQDAATGQRAPQPFVSAAKAHPAFSVASDTRETDADLARKSA